MNGLACGLLRAGLLELSEKLKGDVGEAQRQADKYKGGAQHLREQASAGRGHAGRPSCGMLHR